MKTYQILILIVTILFMTGCKNSITDAGPGGENHLGYVKSHSGEIFTTDLTGTSAQNISNNENTDNYPQWSPDGRYIVYSRSALSLGPHVIVWDTKNNSEVCLTSDGGEADLSPQWTPNGQVCLAYERPVGSKKAFYLMNPDGSNKRKIFEYPPNVWSVTLYFYADNYTFLYMTYNINEQKVYKTNIDRSSNEFIFDLLQSSNQDYVIGDFNPNTGDLLVNTNATEVGGTTAIAVFNTDTKQLKPIITADSGYTYAQEHYNQSYSKIIFTESSPQDSHGHFTHYLSIFDNGVKKRLASVYPTVELDLSIAGPLRMSPDDRYVAFSKIIWSSVNAGISMSLYLYVADVNTGELHYIDGGGEPVWNPRPD